MTRDVRWTLAAALLLFLAGCATYNEIMKDAVKTSLGSDYSNYQYFSYPTNNFGIFTSYVATPGDKTASDDNFLCDSWTCAGVANAAIPSDLKTNLKLNGLAAIGDNGASISLTENKQRDLALSGVLPQIASVLKLNGSFSDKNTTTVTLQLGRAYPRKLLRAPAIAYLNGLPADNLLKAAYLRGDLIVVVADVVLESMHATITVDDSTAAGIDAAMGASSSKIFNDASLSVNVSRAVKGTYTFDISSPVIISRLTKRQPGAGQLATPGDNDWKDWGTVVEKTSWQLQHDAWAKRQ